MKVTNEEVTEQHRKEKYTDKNTEVEIDWAYIANETRLVTKNVLR